MRPPSPPPLRVLPLGDGAGSNGDVRSVGAVLWNELDLDFFSALAGVAGGEAADRGDAGAL